MKQFFGLRRECFATESQDHRNNKAFTFKEIPTKLRRARCEHVALPIPLDIVKQICQNENN